MKKHLKLCLAVLMLAAAAGQARADKAVVVVGKDGDRTVVALNDIRRIDIEPAGIRIHKADGTSSEHGHSGIDRILIGADNTAVKSMLAERRGSIAVWPSVTDGPVSVAGLEPGDKVEVFDTDGRQIAVCQADSEGIATLDISRAKAGICIVNAAGKSVKVVKQ